MNTDPTGTAPPDAVGPFRELLQIAVGSQGPVFRAYDPQRDRLVAVKVFKVELPPERLRQLVAEFERLITADLAHPGIAAPVAAGISGGEAYLAYEFVQAETFDFAIRQYGPAPPNEARRVITQLAGALDFAAAVEIHHGALHPRDVLLLAVDTRITGLGVARALERVGLRVPVHRPYTAPELLRGEAWDRRADVFTLTAIAHELLWGRRVTTSGEVAPSLSEVAGSDLSALRAALSRGLAHRPDDRFPTALEFAEAIDHAFAGRPEEELQLPLQQSTPAPPVTIPPAEARRVESEARAAVPPRSRENESPPTPVAIPMLGQDPKTASTPWSFDAQDTTPSDQLHGRRSGGPSRSLLLIAAVLAIGVGLGFAVGYGLKGPADRATTPQISEVPARSPDPVGPASPRPQAATAAPTPAPPAVPGTVAGAGGREFTENAVPESARSARPPNRGGARSQAEPPASDAVEGRLLVRTEPAGATVFVDGREYGPTPAVVRALARGTHRVRIVYDGYIPEERSVVITRGQPAPSILVTLEPRRAATDSASRTAQSAVIESYSGALVVESLPPGATVFLDNRAVGRTPLTLERVNAGEHVVRLQRDGYRNWSRSVRVVAAERNRVTASLER